VNLRATGLVIGAVLVIACFAFGCAAAFVGWVFS
jgi:hypothetical protein